MHELKKPPRGWKTASAPQAAPGLSHWTHRVITSHAPPAIAGELRPWVCDRPAPCRVCTCPFPRWSDLNKRGLRTRSRTRKFTGSGRSPSGEVALQPCTAGRGTHGCRTRIESGFSDTPYAQRLLPRAFKPVHLGLPRSGIHTLCGTTNRLPKCGPCRRFPSTTLLSPHSVSRDGAMYGNNRTHDGQARHSLHPTPCRSCTSRLGLTKPAIAKQTKFALPHYAARGLNKPNTDGKLTPTARLHAGCDSTRGTVPPSCTGRGPYDSTSEFALSRSSCGRCIF